LDVENMDLNVTRKLGLLFFALIAIALVANCSGGGEDFATLKAKGLEHIGAGDYEKGEASLLLAQKKKPSDRETMFFLGVCQNNLGKDSLAISNFRKVIKLHGPDAETARNLIMASLAGEDWESGLDGLRALVQSGEPMDRLYMEFYEMYLAAGRLLNASRMMDSLIKQEPEQADYYLKAANLKGQLEMYDEAEMQLQEALRRFGPTMETYSNRPLRPSAKSAS
jgi:tetratricopeptide (TPR) repeat protein